MSCNRCDDAVDDPDFRWCRRCSNKILHLIRTGTPPAEVYRYHPME